MVNNGFLKPNRTGFTLIETIVVMTLFAVVLSILSRPLMTILNYPLKVRKERTDRLAGQHVYSRLYLDLRNCTADKVWKNDSQSGELLILTSSPGDYEKADSPGPDVFTLWKYSEKDHTLWRRRWTKSQLSTYGLPIVDQEPSDSEWASFRKAPLVPKAQYVTQFSLDTSSMVSYHVTYTIKNPERNGKAEHYSLEAGTL